MEVGSGQTAVHRRDKTPHFLWLQKWFFLPSEKLDMENGIICEVEGTGMCWLSMFLLNQHLSSICVCQPLFQPYSQQ